MSAHVFSVENDCCIYHADTGCFESLSRPVFSGKDVGRKVDSPNVDLHRISRITIGISSRCELACSYCFEDNNSLLSPLSYGQLDRLVRKLIHLQNVHNRITIDFSGKEPLLEVDKVLYIINRLKRHKHEYVFVISTNGLLLRDEVVSPIDPDISTYYVSFDGYQTLHDKTRKYKNNRGTFYEITDNVRRYVRNHGPEKVVLRMVLNPFEEIDIVKASKELENLNDNFYVLQIIKDRNAISFGKQVQCIEKYRIRLLDYYKYFLYHGLQGRIVKSARIIRRIQQLVAPYRSSAICEGDVNSIYFLNEKDLFPCQELSNDTKYRLADCAQAKLSLRDPQTDCTDCWIRYLCGGRCVYSISEICEMRRLETELAIFVFIELFRESPQILNTIIRSTNWVSFCL